MDRLLAMALLCALLKAKADKAEEEAEVHLDELQHIAIKIGEALPQ